MTQSETSLIPNSYDTVLAPERWPHVLDRIAQMVGARGCMIFELTPGQGPARGLTALTISGRYDRALVDGYLQARSAIELANRDVFARHSASGDGIDVIGDHVLAESDATLAGRPNAPARASPALTRAGRTPIGPGAQGSRLLPLSWVLALKTGDGRDAMFGPSNLARLGYLPNPVSADNPQGLPVGFTVGHDPRRGADLMCDTFPETCLSRRMRAP